MQLTQYAATSVLGCRAPVSINGIVHAHANRRPLLFTEHPHLQGPATSTRGLSQASSLEICRHARLVRDIWY